MNTLKSLAWWSRQVRELRRRGLSDHLAHQVFEAGDVTLVRDLKVLSDEQLADLSRVDLGLRLLEAENEK